MVNWYIFTKKSLFNTFGSNCRRFVWRKPNHCVALKELKIHSQTGRWVNSEMGCNGCCPLFGEIMRDQFYYLNVSKYWFDLIHNESLKSLPRCGRMICIPWETLNSNSIKFSGIFLKSKICNIQQLISKWLKVPL